MPAQAGAAKNNGTGTQTDQRVAVEPGSRSLPGTAESTVTDGETSATQSSVRTKVRVTKEEPTLTTAFPVKDAASSPAGSAVRKNETDGGKKERSGAVVAAGLATSLDAQPSKAETLVSDLNGSPSLEVLKTTMKGGMNPGLALPPEAVASPGTAVTTSPGMVRNTQVAALQRPGGRTEGSAPGTSLSGRPGEKSVETEAVLRPSHGEQGNHVVSNPMPAFGGGISTARAEAPNLTVSLSPATAKTLGPEPASYGLVASAPSVHAANSATTQPPAAPPNSHVNTTATFERMDSAAAPRVIESAPQRLDVGVHSGGLGWVEIHTSSAAGQISATLASGSATTHGAISAQLPAVRDFLAGEHVHVDSLASERFSQSSSGQQGSSSNDGGHGSERGARSAEQERVVRTSTADTERDELSYINVRV